MKETLFTKNILVFLGVILVSGLVARLILIEQVPSSFTHDEMFYAVEGMSVATDGWDLKGKIRPWLALTPSHGAFSELPGSMMAPGFWLFDQPVLAARIMPVILGLVIPLLLGLVAWELTKDRKVFLASVAIAVWNPWIFQFSRSSIDPPFGLLFMILGAWWQIRFKGKKKWWSVGAYFLAFYTYQAYKLVVLPLVVITTIFTLYEEGAIGKKIKLAKAWKLLIPVVVMGLVMVNYTVMVRSQSTAQRLTHLLPFDQNLLSGTVDKQRRLSLPNPLMGVMTNKASVMGEKFMEQYWEAFNPKTLFVHGEEALSPFSVWSVGSFYLVDIVLIGIGIYSLIKKNRRAGFFLLGVLLISPLPTALNTSSLSITFRSSLMLFPVLILAGYGGVEILKWLKKPWIYGGVVIYGLFVLSFLYQYFWRYPLYSADGLFLSDRILSSYIQRSDRRVVVVTNDEPLFLLENYLFFNKKINAENLPKIREKMSEGSFSLGGVEFRDGCIEEEAIEKGELVIGAVGVNGCDKSDLMKYPAVSIAMLTDSGERYRIYNDKLCEGVELRAYLFPQKLGEFAIEKLENDDFCKTWITNPQSLK